MASEKCTEKCERVCVEKCGNKYTDICPCPSKTCRLRGKCCECVNFHRFEETHKLPFCFREKFILKP